MQEKAGQFRSTPFGGFHRQDVLDYIEQLTQEHQETRQRLERQRDEAQAALAQAEDALGQAQRQQAAEATAQTTLEERLAQTQAELENTAAALAQVREEKAALEEKLCALEPEAASWQRLRDTAGDIEVAAHERAQVTLQAARDQAAEIRAQGTRWAQDLQARCLGLQEDLHAAVTNAERELDGARAAFSQAEDHMAQVREALEGLIDE
ncbi:MAG TPA: hypothetical protein H9833_07405 [Candidatus Evtepia faecavium]|nr:hypothetical protein [Candidatus Evtepia faecavium]